MKTSTFSSALLRRKALVAVWLLAALWWAGHARANDSAAAKPAAQHAPKPVEGSIEASTTTKAETVGDQLREALGVPIKGKKKVTVSVSGGKADAAENSAPVSAVSASRAAQRAKAAVEKEEPAHGGEAHWSYEGDTGPARWAQLKPEFNLCAIGKRQSPIAVEEEVTLKGPAEALRFNYMPSNATVINNGHTIQVDVQGENTLQVRGMRYRLLQFHFHTPSEEQINGQRYAMVAHLVHKNEDGGLAVVAVLLQIGEPNPLIEKVWTYMPLDTGDQVRMPRESLNVNELLPADQRYYQFIGSLTTPPCTEGVLWNVLKQPVTISRAQFKLFTQLYSANARPVQPLNGRPVRDAQ